MLIYCQAIIQIIFQRGRKVFLPPRYQRLMLPIPLIYLAALMYWKLIHQGVIFGLVEKFFLTKSGLQMVQPGGIFIEFSEKGFLYPIGISTLYKSQHKHFFTADFGDTLDFHLAWSGAHTGPPGGAAQTGDFLYCLSIDMPCFCQRHFEISLLPGALRLL